MASDHQLLKICMICMVTVLSLAMPSQQQQQLSLTNDTMPADDVGELSITSSPSQYPENLAPESGEYSLSSDSSQYTPPPPPPYINALAPEILEEYDQLRSPDYSPSPYFQDLGPDDQITQYPSPPYIQVEAPEVSGAPEAESYELYSPLQAPSPAPLSGLLGPSSQLPSDDPDDADDVDDVSGSAPPVLPFNYRAEDESADEFEYSEAYSEQSKNRGRVAGFVLGAVCLVGLAGFVFSKKKYNKPKADYEYELAKREDL